MKVDIWSDEFREVVERAFESCAPDPADVGAPGVGCVIEHIAEELGIDPDDAGELLEEFLELEERLNPPEPLRVRYVPLSEFGVGWARWG